MHQGKNRDISRKFVIKMLGTLEYIYYISCKHGSDTSEQNYDCGFHLNSVLLIAI